MSCFQFFLGFLWLKSPARLGGQAGHRQPWPDMIRASNRTHGEYLYRRGVAGCESGRPMESNCFVFYWWRCALPCARGLVCFTWTILDPLVTSIALWAIVAQKPSQNLPALRKVALIISCLVGCPFPQKKQSIDLCFEVLMRSFRNMLVFHTVGL
jgi:hypothetical protein